MTPKKILIVDDNSVTRGLIAASLYEAGQRSSEAENGKQALDVLKSNPDMFDAVILDYHMEEMNGEELLVTAKEQQLSLPPVMMLTGDGAPNLQKQAEELGINKFVLKPFTPRQIIRHLSELVGEELSPPSA